MTSLRPFLLFLVYASIGCAVGQAQEARPDNLIGLTPLSATQQPIDGYWEGFVESHGARLIINVEFKTAPDGIRAIIDIPDLYIHGYKLTNARYESPSVRFELPLSREPDKFDGAFKGEIIEGTYSGRFYQAETQSAHFILRRLKKKPLPYRQEEVSFQNGDVKLAGSLFIPLKKGRHPGIVFFHGSGPQTRESYLRFFADLFARRGIATLIFDKRGTGASTGEVWYRTGDRFDNLVADGLSGVQFLLNRPDINPKKVGLWGLSQGGWLAPLAASRSKDIAFLIVVSGGGVTPAEQEVYDDEVKLRDKGYPQEEVAEAVALLRLADDVIRGRESWEKFAAARAQAQKKEWFALLDRFPVKLPKEDDTWRAGGEGLDFDPRPLWEQTSIPALAIFGEADKSTPSGESARRIELALQKGGNKDHTIKIFPNADHALLVPTGNGSKWDWGRPASGWLDLMINWLQRHTK
jgi:pimeloyl-ACP methyl ester carboxylesterase